MPHKTQINRRRFLKVASSLTAALASSTAFSNPLTSIVPQASGEKRLGFYNLHTCEQINIPFWAGGHYLSDGLNAINRVLRDHRNDQQAEMDVRLLELLYRLKGRLGTDGDFHIISGYRSPQTNAMLSNRSNGVAKKSLHMRGMAVDIRVPKVELTALKNTALSLRGGGVGYYPESDFLHIDVGRIRSWG